MATETEIETFTEWGKRMGWTAEFSAVNSRPNDSSDWSKDALHFAYTLLDDKRNPVVTGFYSVGSAHPGTWAKKSDAACRELGIRSPGYLVRNAVRELNSKGLNPRSVYAESLRAPIITAFKAAAPIPLGQLLESLHCDISSADQSFEDWCGDFGMDTDSRKAHKMYEICRDTFFAMRRAMPAGEFDNFLNLQE